MWCVYVFLSLCMLCVFVHVSSICVICCVCLSVCVHMVCMFLSLCVVCVCLCVCTLECAYLCSVCFYLCVCCMWCVCDCICMYVSVWCVFVCDSTHVVRVSVAVSLKSCKTTTESAWLPKLTPGSLWALVAKVCGRGFLPA